MDYLKIDINYDSLIANRAFSEQKRYIYFKKLRYHFQQLYDNYINLKAEEKLSLLYNDLLSIKPILEECLYYSREALFGYENGVIPSYSKEHTFGVLEEERIFKILIEEIYSLFILLENFIMSEYNLLNYKIYILQRKARSDIKSGFINNILKKIESNKHIELLDSQINFLLERIKTLNEINKIILTKHKFIKDNLNEKK